MSLNAYAPHLDYKNHLKPLQGAGLTAPLTLDYTKKTRYNRRIHQSLTNMNNLKPATSYNAVFDTNRVQSFNRNESYRIPLQTGTGHYTSALARFTDESGWEYLHLSYDRWLPIPDNVEIFTL